MSRSSLMLAATFAAGALSGAAISLHAQTAAPILPRAALGDAATHAELSRLEGEVHQLSARVTVLENRAGVGLTKPMAADDWKP